MPDNHSDASACEGLFVIRKPVFDREQLVLGHEIDAGASASDIAASMDNISNCMSGDGLDMTLGGDGQGKILVSLDHDRLFVKDFLRLPRERTVFALSPGLTASPEVAERVQVIADLGFSLCVTAKTVIPKDFVDLSGMIRVDLSGLAPKEIMALVREIKPLGKPMFAVGVDDWQTFEGTRALGFSWFQGAFFSTPKVVPGKKLSQASLARIQVMQELMRPGCDMNRLAGIIANDSVLSYRLLGFINSASFSLMQKVGSIQQAVALLGLNQLKQWVSFMVMAEMDTSPKGEELSYSGLQRARFLGQCAAVVSTPPAAPDSMFMAGLFSRLDAMLGLPMREVLANMPIDESLSAALCGQPGPLRGWLDLAESVERGNWERARTQLAGLGIEPRVAAVEYLRASAWAGEHFRDHQDSK